MKSSIIANQKNIGLLIDRFRRFIERNLEKTFEVKNVWGKPRKRENWDRNPRNYEFIKTPKISRHPLFKEGECLLSVIPQTERDIINIHFSGYRPHFDEFYPHGIDFSKNPLHSFILEEGDEVFFKDRGIIIIPKREHIIINKKCSWMLCCN